MKTLIYLLSVLLLTACPRTDEQSEQSTKGQDLKNKPLKTILTPADKKLFDAVKANDAGLIDRAIKAGADKEARNKAGWTALMVASDAGHTEAVNALLEAKVKLEEVDTEGNTALILAASKGHTAIVNALVKKRSK